MPEKKSALLQKVSNLLKISIFLAKLKKPVIPKLVFLKKTRKLRKFKLLKQYNHFSYYGKEYEFSPSNTPLIRFQRKAQSGRVNSRKLYSNFFFISKCLGRVRDEEQQGIHCWEVGILEQPLAVGRELSIDLSNSWSEEEDDSVDERAEIFTRRFYEEMRRQRQDSISHLLEM